MSHCGHQLTPCLLWHQVGEGTNENEAPRKIKDQRRNTVESYKSCHTQWKTVSSLVLRKMKTYFIEKDVDSGSYPPLPEQQGRKALCLPLQSSWFALQAQPSQSYFFSFKKVPGNKGFGEKELTCNFWWTFSLLFTKGWCWTALALLFTQAAYFFLIFLV